MKMLTSRLTWIITLISATVLLGGAVAGCGDPKSTQSSPVSSQSREPVAPLKTVEWKPDTRYSFGLTLSSQADVEAQGAMFDFDLSATLAVFPVETAQKVDQLLMVLENPVFRSQEESAAKTKQFQQLAEELGNPFLVSLDQGIMRDIHLLQEATAFAAGIYRTIAAGFQIVPSDTPSSPWQVTEYDATGAYLVEYSVAPQSGAILKRKIKYTKTLQDKRSTGQLAQNTGLPRITGSSGEILVEKGTIRTLTLSDVFHLPVAVGSAIRSRTKLALELSEQKPGAVPPEWQSMRQRYRRYARDEAFLRPVSQEVLDAARMRGRSFEQLVADLELIEKDPNRIQTLKKAVHAGMDEQAATAKGEKWMSEWMPLFNALPAFFRQQPQTVSAAVKRIEQGSPARESLLGGLSATGTEAAQKALLQMALSKGLTDEMKKSAMVSLIRCKDPQPATTNALVQMLEGETKLRTYAIYGLGTMARNLREGGKEEASGNLAAVLTALLEQTKDQLEKSDILYGIANSGHVGALKVVRPYLAHRDPSLRAAALAAVRLMDHPEVDGLIAAGMNSAKEKDRKVREAAIRAAKPRTPSPVLMDALSQVVLHDEKKSTRYRAVELLCKWLPKQPELGQTLQKVVESDNDLVIRGKAAAALKKMSAKPTK